MDDPIEEAFDLKDKLFRAIVNFYDNPNDGAYADLLFIGGQTAGFGIALARELKTRELKKGTENECQ